MKLDLKAVIRRRRRLSGLTQVELAKLAGVSKTLVFDIEHGKETVQLDTLKKVLAVLNIEMVLRSPVLECAARQTAKPSCSCKRKAAVFQQGGLAGFLEETDRNHYRFRYSPGYRGEPVSLALPVRQTAYEFEQFPPLFEGLLPEGLHLEALLQKFKVDRGDLFTQLLIVGEDMVGSLTVKEAR